MGLIDFIKDAGQKVFGRDDDGEPAAEAAPAETAAGKSDAERLADLRKASALVKSVRTLEFPVDGLTISYDDGTATVLGTVPDQATREKVVLVVGNTHGVARVDDRLKVEAPEPEATYYTVQRGDTLSAIAKAHYGAASKYPVIFEANRPMLTDPDKIYPGQVLRIPPA